ncbi:TetR/AcrR family transcriptional regulator [Streptococcus massiliensis]|uniref:Putative transcriptional regulator n=1 Tax=Streptococcus massiliensis TaxID=313439 RepID=A0A380L2B3_9STRE|nr:TetR/AcrR family transcriptional regulator C-terminal domain-containing protein [Streptococcus massiliensis]SUN77387.1 putative transcriptional regulator [Streptococcus massiliensis]
MQKRQTETKEMIKQALTELLLEEKFEDISVSKLTRRAGINRGTFYLHYLDKYDMMNKIKCEIISQMHTIFEEDLSPQDLIIRNLTQLKENHSFVYAVYKSNYINLGEVIREFMMTVIKTGDQKKTDHFLDSNFSIPRKYALEVFLSSIEGIILLWIANGAKESPQEIAEIMLQLFNYDAWR